MSEEMDDFYQKIQTWLIRKDPEVGKLKFLSSRTTEENIHHIDEIITSVGLIFEVCNIPIKGATSICNIKCIEALKYLILNTNFGAQEFLQDDHRHGHLVDMCPPLSPYLFIELIWYLEYEQVLAESILHLPLDLCIEILEILRRCLPMLEFPRGFNLVLILAKNAYIKVLIIKDLGTQSQNFEANLEGLLINYQEILSSLSDKRCTRLQEVFDVEKSERHGYILREMLKLVRDCLELSEKDVNIYCEREKLYKITFGRNGLQRCNAEAAMTYIKALNLGLTNVLLTKVKEIDCNIFLDWASLEDDCNESGSLQQMIGIECFHLIHFLEILNIEAQAHLVECLKHLSVNPESLNNCTTMTLEALCERVEKGNPHCLKELLIRHKNWDHSTFDVVRKNVNLFDRENVANLLEYLTELTVEGGNKEHMKMLYNITTRVFYLQNLKDLYEITVEYILKHNATNILETFYTERMFMAFLHKNSDFKAPNKLKTIFFFLLKNPSKFLMILMRICIGSKKYNNIIVNSDDLILLSPVMIIHTETEKLVLSCLLSITQEKYEFAPIKFCSFIKSMLQHRIFTPNELIQSVYIPLMENTDLPASTVRSTFNSIRHMFVKLNEGNKTMFKSIPSEKKEQI